jgi:hypothetical protein
MEAGFGADLRRVRIHDGDRAERAASALGAQAYTVGQHLVFGRGRYSPSTPGGKRLLSHELAHAVQQSRDARGPNLGITSAEHAADRASQAVARGEAAGPVGSAPTGVQRAPADGNESERGAGTDDKSKQAESDDVSKLALTTAERTELVELVRTGRVPVGAGAELTGDEATDTTLLAEYFFFRALRRSPIEPFELFSVFPGAIHVAPIFQAFREKFIVPEYAKLPEALRKALADRRSIRTAIDSGALNIGKSGTVGFQQTERALTEAPPPGPPPKLAQHASPDLTSAIAELSRKATQRRAAQASGAQADDFAIATPILRPSSPKSLHAKGRAVDVTRYAGQRIDVKQPDEVLEGVAAIIRDLPPGFYALGLPREPEARDFERHPEFFKRPPGHTPSEPEPSDLGEKVQGRNRLQFKSGVKANTPPGATIDDDIAALRSEETRKLMKALIDAAKKRGVIIVHLFPDDTDHVHLSTGGPGIAKEGKL